MNEFAIELRKEQDHSLIAIQGRLDVFTSLRFQEALGELEQSGETQIELDLSEVTYMDSTGAGVLVGAYKRLTSSSGDLWVSECSPVVHKVLNILGIIDWMRKRPG